MINKQRFYDRLKFVFRISEFQAEGLGFRNFAWLGSNPSYAPAYVFTIYTNAKLSLLSFSQENKVAFFR